MKVGFVGLGQMGSGMAASLLKAGHEVIVYNRTPAKAEPLIAKGKGRRQYCRRLPGGCRYHHAGKRQRRRGRGARQRRHH